MYRVQGLGFMGLIVCGMYEEVISWELQTAHTDPKRCSKTLKRHGTVRV